MKKFVLKKEQPPERKANYTLAYQSELNRQQYEAVFHDKGPLLVIAGAGTGKTRTLIYRLARLIEAGNRADEILLLTFTRRAASEMLNRASGILDQRCRGVRGGTFHFYCSQLLHRHAGAIDYPENFTIIDTSDAKEILQILRAEVAISKKGKRFPKNGTIYSIYSTSVNKQLSIKETVSEYYPQFEGHTNALADMKRRYDEYKRGNKVMDFDDLLVHTIGMMERDDSLRRRIASDHRYVMVDEYQDTNVLQARLTELFSSEHGNVMAVGDDAQSIYSFRGANHRNIMEFPEQFEGARIIKLEENYRSTQPILDLSNELIDQASFGYKGSTVRLRRANGLHW